MRAKFENRVIICLPTVSMSITNIEVNKIKYVRYIPPQINIGNNRNKTSIESKFLSRVNAELNQELRKYDISFIILKLSSFCPNNMEIVAFTFKQNKITIINRYSNYMLP